MRDEYDFSKDKRGAAIGWSEKTRIAIMLDDDIIKAFRAKAEDVGAGYQTLINAALRNALATVNDKEKPLTVAALRRVLRKELHAA